MLMYKYFTSEESLFTREEKIVCSCINVRVFNIEKFIHTRRKSRCSCINVHVFTSEESLFTCEEKVFAHVYVYVYLLVKKVYSHMKKKV
jgi:hypothetical protein